MIKSALALLAFLLASPAYADITSIAAIAAGSNGDVQFNNNRRFSADTGNLTYSTSTKALTVQGLVTSTVTVNGITYYLPTSECSGGTFFRYDGGGIVTCSNPSTFTVSTGVALGVWDGAVNITTATSDLSFNADQFVVSLQGDTTASISLNASSVTVMGPLTVAAPITLSGSQFGIDKSSATLLGPNPTLGGDLSGTVTNAVVTDDSHNHTTTSISGLDISADTNLSAAPPIVLSGDTITIDKSSVTLLGPTLEAAELPADGYASTYVNASGDSMSGQLTVGSSVTVKGANGLYSTYGISGGSLTARNLANTLVAVDASGVLVSTSVYIPSGQAALGISSGSVIVSSPTSQVSFDGYQFTVALVGVSTASVTLNSSSVTLQGQNVITNTPTLQSGFQFSVSSGSVSGPMYVGTMTVTGDLAVGDDATIAGGLTVAGGSGVTVDSLTPLKCVETDASGRLVSASDLCGTGSGGSGASLETIFGTAQSSPTATLKGDSNFQGSVTGSTMTISLADNVTLSTATFTGQIVLKDGTVIVSTSTLGGGLASLPLPSGDTNYIQNTDTLQSGATFYVSSGTVGYLNVGQVKGFTPNRMLLTDSSGTAATAAAFYFDPSNLVIGINTQTPDTSKWIDFRGSNPVFYGTKAGDTGDNGEVAFYVSRSSGDLRIANCAGGVVNGCANTQNGDASIYYQRTTPSLYGPIIWHHAYLGDNFYTGPSFRTLGVSQRGIIIQDGKSQRIARAMLHVGSGGEEPNPSSRKIAVDDLGDSSIVVISSGTGLQGYLGVISTYVVVGSTSPHNVHLEANGVNVVELSSTSVHLTQSVTAADDVLITGYQKGLSLYDTSFPDTTSEEIKFYTWPGTYGAKIGFQSGLSGPTPLRMAGVYVGSSTEDLVAFPTSRGNPGGGAVYVDKGMVIYSTGTLSFMDSDSSNYVGLKAPNTVPSTTVWTLPSADASGCFQSDGSGNMSIAACGGSGGGAPSNAMLLKDSDGILWSITVGTSGNLTSTSLGAQTFDPLPVSIYDSNNDEWAISVSTSGALTTEIVP